MEKTTVNAVCGSDNGTDKFFDSPADSTLDELCESTTTNPSTTNDSTYNSMVTASTPEVDSSDNTKIRWSCDAPSDTRTVQGGTSESCVSSVKPKCDTTRAL